MHRLLHSKSHEAIGNRFGKYKAREQVGKVNSLSVDLGAALGWTALGTEASRAVNDQLSARGAADLGGIQSILAPLCKATAAAYHDLGLLPNKPTKRRPPPKDHAVSIAARCAVVFEALTGKRPTRVVKDGQEIGPSVQFVAEVFKVGGVDASAARAAQKALSMEKSRRKEPKTP